MSRDGGDHFNLLFASKTLDSRLYNIAWRRHVLANEALIVHECEEAHDELAIHAVCDAAVSGNRLAKIFDLECAFQPRRKESAKGSDQGCKCREHQDVELDRLDAERS